MISSQSDLISPGLPTDPSPVPQTASSDWSYEIAGPGDAVYPNS